MTITVMLLDDVTAGGSAGHPGDVVALANAEAISLLKGGHASLIQAVTVVSGGVGGGAMTVADGADAALGATTDAAVSTDAVGTVSAKLRGLIKLILAKINIATVDTITKINELVPGVAAADLGKAEDAVHTSGDVGSAILGVRADTPAPSAANGDYHNILIGPNGEAWVSLATQLDSVNDSIMPYAKPANLIDGHSASMTDISAHAIIAAQAAGVRTYLTQITITNGHATVDTWVDVLDGSTVRWSVFAAAKGGGACPPFPAPLKGTAATAWNAQNRTTGAAVEVCASGYIGA